MYSETSVIDLPLTCKIRYSTPVSKEQILNVHIWYTLNPPPANTAIHLDF